MVSSEEEQKVENGSRYFVNRKTKYQTPYRARRKTDPQNQSQYACLIEKHLKRSFLFFAA